MDCITRACAVAGAATRCAIADTELAHQHDVLALVAEALGEKALGLAEAVDLGGVEEVDSQIEPGVNGANDLVFVDVSVGAPHLPAAEADGGYVEAGQAEFPVFHARPSWLEVYVSGRPPDKGH